MRSPVVPSSIPGSGASRAGVAVALVLGAGALVGPAVPAVGAQPGPASTSVLLTPKDYPPPPSWSTRRGICSAVGLGEGRVRHGLPPSEYNTVMTSLRIVGKRRVSCSKARTFARRYFVKGAKSGFTWRSTKSWGRDDGVGATQYEGTRRGGLRVVFIGSS